VTAKILSNAKPQLTPTLREGGIEEGGCVYVTHTHTQRERERERERERHFCDVYSCSLTDPMKWSVICKARTQYTADYSQKNDARKSKLFHFL
jgi:hypothetical protein